MRRRRRVVLAFAVVMLVGVAALWGRRPLDRWQRQRRAGEAFAAVGRCMFGAELPPPARAERRLRAVTLAAQMHAEHGSWPSRCEPYAEALLGTADSERYEARTACGLPAGCCPNDVRCERLSTVRAETARMLELIEEGKSPTFDPEAWLTAAAELGWDHEAPGRVPPAPAPAPLIDPAGMRPLFSGNYLRLLSDPAGDATAELLFYEDETRYGACDVDLRTGARSVGHCRQLSADIPVGLAGELLAAEQGAPSLMFAQGPQGDHGWVQGIYDVSTGQRVTTVAQRPAGGFVFRDGTVARVGVSPPMAGLSLYRARDGADLPPVPLDIDDASSGPRLVWDEVVWTEPLGEGRHRVLSRKLLRGDVGLTPARVIGDTASIGDPPRIDTCRTDEALILMVVAATPGAGVRGVLAFRTAAGWQPPLAVTTSSTLFGFTCQGQSATLSWVRGDREVPDAKELTEADPEGGARPITGRYHVHRVRCDLDGCEHGKVVVPLHRYARESRYVAGDLGDTMVLLWRSPFGDVRMRVAALEDLPFAPDRPLFDDVEHDGFGWDLESDPIFGRAGSVLLLISRQVGTSEDSATFGLRIDPTGQVSPIEVSSDRM